jgi:hypothetical protein
VPPNRLAATPDFVGGAVISWGCTEVHATGMHAEAARVVGVELPIWRARMRRKVVEVAERLGSTKYERRLRLSHKA